MATPKLWRVALSELTAALATASGGGELLEAKAELTAALKSTAVRAQAAGCGPLLETMVLAAHGALKGEQSIAELYKLLSSMTAKLRVRVDHFDSGTGSLGASAVGEWALWGKSYSFSAKIREDSGRRTGTVVIQGLDFNAGGDLSKGTFTCDTAVAEWLRASGVKLSVEAARQAVIPALEILATKRAKGVADIEVLEIVFELLRKMAGLPPKPAEQDEADADDNDEEELDELSEAEEADEPDDADEQVDKAIAEAAAAQLADPADEDEEDESVKVMTGSSSSSLASAKSTLKLPLASSSGPAAASSTSASKCVLDMLDGDDSAAGKNGDDDQESDAAEQEEDAVEQDASEDEAESEFQDDTMFVSTKMLNKIKAKLAKKRAPTQTELTKLFDDNLAEDEELVCLDFSMIGQPADGDKPEIIRKLIKDKGLKAVAELVVSAEVVVDHDDEEEEEEICDDEQDDGDDEMANESKEDQQAVPKAASKKQKTT